MNPNRNSSDLSISGSDPASQSDPDNLVESGRQGFALEVRRMSVKASRGAVSLKNISFYVQPGDFVILAGPEHAGKLTLIQSLAGIRHINDGQVLLDGRNLSELSKSFRSRIGFVPRQDVAAGDLKVFEALIQAARLRLGNSTSQEQHRRVEDVLEELGLGGQSKALIRDLDAGQRKRVNIGIELVAEPGILFLDEPTLNLDASQGGEIVQLLQRLADQGLAVLMTDRSSQYLMLAGRIVILFDGSMVWYGPPGEVFQYLSGYASKIDADSRQTGLGEVFRILADPDQGTPEEWAGRFQSASAYKQYALLSSKNKEIQLAPDERPLVRIRARAIDHQASQDQDRVSGFKQFFILLGRNFTLLWRDRMGLFLVLALPVVLGSLDLLFSSQQMYDLTRGNPVRIILTLALLVFFALLVGGAAWVRDFPREAGFYRRERQIYLKLWPYVFAKVFVIALLALYQAAVLTGIHYFAAGLPGGIPVALYFFITLALTALLGGILGLIASTITVSERRALVVFSIFLIPQLIFSGAFIPKASLNVVGATLTSIMPSRFAFETLSTADGHGSDLANDPCWQLPKSQRDSLVDQQKQVCTCMGSNIFKLCSFPGIRQFYVPQIDQAPPSQPDASKISQFPVQPIRRPGESLDQYAQEVDAYTVKIENNQADMGIYFQQLNKYMDDFSAWEMARNTAISKAEGQLEYQFENYAPIFNASLLGNWLILLGMIVLFIILYMILLRGKDLA